MLPPRAYAETAPPVTPRAQPADIRPALIVVGAAEDLERFPASPYARFGARSTLEAVRLIERWRPRVIVADLDIAEVDLAAICAAATHVAPVGVLAVTQDPQRVPSALKVGCHAVLLKPFSLNLVAARLGRLCREMPSKGANGHVGTALPQWGTNRVWPDVHCPTCGDGDAVCFEYTSHRRSWYACLKCEHVWLGRRRE